MNTIGIREAQQQLADLITSRTSIRQLYTPAHGSPVRAIGERMLNKFAGELVEETSALAQKEQVEEELLESLLNTLAIAGMLGIDLEFKLREILAMMDNVVAEAS